MELRATTLAETLVASVIFLTCFIIATDSLVNITVNEAAAQETVAMELETERCMEKFSRDTDTRYMFRYRWGTVTCERHSYSGFHGLYRTDVTIQLKNRRKITYIYLEEHETQ